MITPTRIAVGTAVTSFLVPPGACQLTISAGTSVLYLGSGSAVSSSNGFQMAANSTIQITQPPTSSPTTLYATASTGGTLSTVVGLIFATAQ